MATNQSFSDLLEFLDFVIERGLMNSETASSYKVACNKVFGVLDEKETDDLSIIDLDQVYTRFQNLSSGQMRPKTMKAYISRAGNGLSDFLAYRENPSAWKPSVQQRAPRANTRADKGKDQPEHQVNGAGNEQKLNGNNDNGSITHRFRLRPDVIVQILGIPDDLTIHEARRLAAYIATLSPEFMPTQSDMFTPLAPPEISGRN